MFGWSPWPTRLARLVLALTFALAAAAAATGRAEEEKEPVAIQYGAPPGCPREAEVLARLSARTTKTRALLPGERGRRFDLEVEATPQGVRGRVTITSPDGATVTRQIPAKTCDEVVAAMVLVTALAIDPRAALGPLPDPTAIPSAPPESAPPPPPARSARPGGARGASKPAAPVEGPRPVLRAAPAGARSATFSFGARAVAALGVEPGGALGGGVLAGVQWERAGPWAPAVRLGVDVTAASEVRLELGSARFSWFAAHLDLCPLRLGISVVEIAPCLLGEAGALTGTGLGVPKATHAGRIWSAGGALGRVTVPILGPFALEASAAVTFPLRRYEYVLAPSTEVHRVTAVGARFGLGATTRFP